MARSAWDCAAMLRVMAGHDPGDPDSSDVAVPDYLAELTPDLAGVRLGVARENHFPASADPALAQCFEDAIAALEGLGATSVEVTLPHWSEAGFATLVTLAADAVAYHRPHMERRWDDYFSATRDLLTQGTLLSAADYQQAQRVRQTTDRSLQQLFEDVDLILSPTTSSGAFAYDEHDVLPNLEAVDATLFTGYWSAVGYPALAVPMGFTVEGLPLSLQIAGRPFDDGLVLRAGYAYQRITDWHLRLPPLVTETGLAGRDQH
jgi:aspartyl-tRNA(Asn)/glutamyl-tRNA(Gln) amidotransferase subunit A